MSTDLRTPRLGLRVIAMPKDTNPYGSIFGGVILSYIDQAAFVQARLHAPCRWVTLALDRVEFKKPVYVGDTLNFFTRTVRTGTSSVTVEVDVQAERFEPPPVERTGAGPRATAAGDRFPPPRLVPVTHATLVMVAVDHAGRAVPFAGPSAGDPFVQQP